LVAIRYPRTAKYILFIIKVFFRSLRKIGLKRLSTVGDGIDCLFRNYYFIAACILKNKCGENEVFIGGDPGSLIAAHYLAKKKKGTLIYWSLELYIEKDLDNFGLRRLKRAERRCNQQALFTVDFGEIRCKVLQEENRLDPVTMISIPNSQIGRGKIVRNYYFNDKFNIPKHKVIILHAGALFGPWLHVKDIFQSIHEWPDDYILVLHTHRRPYPGCGFSIPDEYLNKKIFLSDDPVPFDQLDTIYSSCDIGIMVHGPAGTPLDENLYYSDLSVGKIFHHLKVGVPIIVRNLAGYSELFEGRQAGVCVNGPQDILPAIQKIMNSYDRYRVNALKLHEEFRFELHHAKLSERINVIFVGKE
jgi:glycosyltransferase involved in cell wall biosynthesis